MLRGDRDVALKHTRAAASEEPTGFYYVPGGEGERIYPEGLHSVMLYIDMPARAAGQWQGTIRASNGRCHCSDGPGVCESTRGWLSNSSSQHTPRDAAAPLPRMRGCDGAAQASRGAGRVFDSRAGVQGRPGRSSTRFKLPKLHQPASPLGARQCTAAVANGSNLLEGQSRALSLLW